MEAFCKHAPAIMQRLAEACSKRVDSERDPKLDEVIHAVLGETHRVLAGDKAFALSFGMDYRTARECVIDIAAAAHFSARAWASATLSSMLVEMRLNKLKPVASIIYTVYDETPLPLRSIVARARPGHFAGPPVGRAACRRRWC